MLQKYDVHIIVLGRMSVTFYLADDKFLCLWVPTVSSLSNYQSAVLIKMLSKSHIFPQMEISLVVTVSYYVLLQGTHFHKSVTWEQ